jgi:glycine/D-amino acid oxidase-like deaminating enzyme
MPNRLYHENMYQFWDPEPSYWEATQGVCELAAKPLFRDEQCEVAIIGGGYTGLSAAYHLGRDHQVDTRVLEAGHIGWGASGRNGGFCSIGGTSLGLNNMIARYGLEEARKYYRSQVDAVELVAEIIREEEIDSPLQGDAELTVACTPKAFKQVTAYAENQSNLLGLNASVLTREQFAEQYFDFPRLHGAATLKPTFGLHPMRYIRGLAAAAEKQGAFLHPRSEVIEWTNDGASHILTTKGGTLRARYVILATNGFTPEHLLPAFHARTMPIISAIVVTRPLDDNELAAHAWRTESPAITSYDLLNYFRVLPDKRLMWGGRGSSNGAAAGTAKNFAALTDHMHEFFPEWRHVGIDYQWHGLVCLTRRLTPCIGRLEDDPSVFFGFGYHGNGVNTATWTGKKISDWLGGTRTGDRRRPDSLPAVVQGLSVRFPLAALRLLYVQARITMFRFTDWLK